MLNFPITILISGDKHSDIQFLNNSKLFLGIEEFGLNTYLSDKNIFALLNFRISLVKDENILTSSDNKLKIELNLVGNEISFIEPKIYYNDFEILFKNINFLFNNRLQPGYRLKINCTNTPAELNKLPEWLRSFITIE